MHDPDKLLYAIGDRVDELEKAMRDLAQKEADLRSWESLSATKMQGEGMSATASEKAVRSLPQWKEFFLMVENAKVDVEILKHKIRLGTSWWETWRSLNSSSKRVA